MKILLVDDDHQLVDRLRASLEREGYTVEVAYDGDDGWWMITEGSYDLVVLDVMLPSRDGHAICRDLRAAGNWTPVLMLTARSDDLDEVEALDVGADDYVAKPCSTNTLLARIRALLRRAATRSVTPTEVGDLRLDPRRRVVWRGETEIPLTTRQFDVLHLLVRHADEVVSKDQILAGVWSLDYDGDPNIVEVYVRRLRARIDEPFGRRSIRTVRGAGYRLVADDG